MVKNIDELAPQPAALEKMINFYLQGKGKPLLETLPHADMPLFVAADRVAGAASAAALHCRHLGAAAASVHLSEVRTLPAGLLSRYSPLICLSPSGDEPEIPQFLRKVEQGPLAAITNEEQSTLAQSANIVLPLMAGKETPLTRKAYLNSLVLTWLVSRLMCGVWDGSEEEQLARVVSRVRVLQLGKASILNAWHDVMDGMPRLIFTGQGSQAISAFQGASVMAETARTLVHAVSLESLRNSFIELSEPGVGVVIFANSESGLRTELDLADELDGYGVNVLLVIDGMPRRIREEPPLPVGFDPFISTVLDAISPQLWAIELAAALNGGGGAKRRKAAKG